MVFEQQKRESAQRCDVIEHDVVLFELPVGNTQIAHFCYFLKLLYSERANFDVGLQSVVVFPIQSDGKERHNDEEES